ncbi:quinone oxidoreductase family protein [Sulfobacillus harzensis]|uniref:Quinone oxidoreductase n=1 Tax=Sulfobacillus harzensis TaxID=2729629 RepID=A0A7Y0L1Q2_9FIRM|nr:quinone oxidoreductase [Sulfobacillus harzensis]NMP21681.1 quinone oxidoreductase [Sulfobacillus harzensis]
MKAVVVTALGGPEVLRLEEVAAPEPQPGEVLIRVAATSVNFADIKARQGRYHGAGQPPFIPGLDAAGTVEAIGDGVGSVAVGDRVIAFPKGGSYAEYVVAPANLVFPIPAAVDWDQAAALPTVAFTAYKLLHDVGRVVPGERVLVHAAAGGVGTTAIQLAKLMGASMVIGTVSRKEKASVARDAGADAVINYSQEDFVAPVRELTDGQGADVILDSVGGTVAERSLEALAWFGRLVHFGSASGETGHIRVGDLHASCRAVLGFSLGTARARRPELLKPAADAVLAYVQSGQLAMRIGRRYHLHEAADAQKWMESRESTGKIVLLTKEAE